MQAPVELSGREGSQPIKYGILKMDPSSRESGDMVGFISMNRGTQYMPPK